MEDIAFAKLREQAAERISEIVPETSSERVKDRIRREFEAVRDSGELLTLNRAEVRLLYEYRLWAQSPAAVSGVFHWKRPSPKVLMEEEVAV